MKKRMIIMTALIMGTLGAGCVSVQASDTLPELTKDNALEQMMKAGETDSLVSNHKSYEATCEYILQNTKVYDYEDSEVMYVDMYGTTQMLYKDGELKYGKEGDEYLSCLYIDEADGNADDLISFYTDETIEEEVTDLKEDGDTIIIQTKVPEELTQSALNSQGDGESYTEGDWISMEYVVASDDYRPLKHTQILNHKDGTSEEASKMEFSYGVDRPEDVADLCEKYEEAEKAEADRDNANNKLNEDTKKFEDLTKALNDYEAKLEEEKAAKTNLDNADKAVKDKEEALAAANEAKTNAEVELSKSKTENEKAKKAFEEATKALDGKKNEYLNAVKKLNIAKIDAMTLLKLIYGDKSGVTSGVKEALKFSCNGSLKYFTGITIDGNFIPANEYKAVSGSTVVTIPSAYWNRLSSGKHTFQFEYEYGSSNIGTFTIAANEEDSEQIVNPNNNTPMTGDADSYVLLSGGLFLVSTILLYRSLKRKEEE